MTPYTKTLIGQITSVKTGAFTATLIEDNEGRLPIWPVYCIRRSHQPGHIGWLYLLLPTRRKPRGTNES